MSRISYTNSNEIRINPRINEAEDIKKGYGGISCIFSQ